MSDMMPSDGPNAPAAEAPLPELKFLKTLVTVLAATMIVGLIAVIALLVIRLGPQNAASPTAALALPESVTLPEGAVAQSISLSDGRIVVLTRDDQVFVYDAAGALLGATTLIQTP
jgi:hypothetical protein